MFRSALLGLLALLSLRLASAQTKHPDPRDLAFRQLSADIHLAYRPVPLRYWVEGNVTIIINDNDVVVVDGSGSDHSARQVIAYIESITDKPVTVLINTHGHGDHTIGNSEYARKYLGIEIVAHPATYEYLTGAGIGYVSDIAKSIESRQTAGAAEIARVEAAGGDGVDQVLANLRQYYEHDILIRQKTYSEATIQPPTILVDRALTLVRGERKIEVLHLGPGDTKGDLVVFLPQDRIVATGDMIVHPFPYGFSRHALDWANTLEALAELDFDTLIPGHGDVLTGKSYLQDVRSLLLHLQRVLRQAIDEGLSYEDAAQRVDLSAFKDRMAGNDPVVRYYFDEYFTTPQVRRTYDGILASKANR